MQVIVRLGWETFLEDDLIDHLKTEEAVGKQIVHQLYTSLLKILMCGIISYYQSLDFITRSSVSLVALIIVVGVQHSLLGNAEVVILSHQVLGLQGRIYSVMLNSV